MSSHRSNRPIAWMAFGIGGFLVAFFFPVHIFLFGIAQPLGLVRDPGYQSMLDLVHAPLTRLYLAVLLIFAFWHAAYRLRDTICDAAAMRQLDIVVAAVCYGGAIAGTIATVVMLLRVP
jgi:fumarate reductase subunit D